MQLTLLDKSNYLKGLLVVAKKDKQLTESEKNIIRKIANKLGFATEFYEETLKNLIENKYIVEDPIKFSSVLVADSFLSDGLKLVLSDINDHSEEMSWLRSTAEINGIDTKNFNDKIKKVKESSHTEFALWSII